MKFLSDIQTDSLVDGQDISVIGAAATNACPKFVSFTTLTETTNVSCAIDSQVYLVNGGIDITITHDGLSRGAVVRFIHSNDVADVVSFTSVDDWANGAACSIPKNGYVDWLWDESRWITLGVYTLS